MRLEYLHHVRELAQEVASLCWDVEEGRLKAEEAGTYYSHPVLTGRLNRRSMDLTRALAALRGAKR
jgi:hypothetical protein